MYSVHVLLINRLDLHIWSFRTLLMHSIAGAVVDLKRFPKYSITFLYTILECIWPHAIAVTSSEDVLLKTPQMMTVTRTIRRG